MCGGKGKGKRKAKTVATLSQNMYASNDSTYSNTLEKCVKTKSTICVGMKTALQDLLCGTLNATAACKITKSSLFFNFEKFCFIFYLHTFIRIYITNFVLMASYAYAPTTSVEVLLPLLTRTARNLW